jgi:cytochrome P450
MTEPTKENTDPFRAARQRDGVLKCPFNGEEITMLLRHADVRRAASDWKTFSSDAPFRVPIPSEEAVRTIRQLPIELDPPLHAEYRALTEPFFQRAKQADVIAGVKAMMDAAVLSKTTTATFDAVADFSLTVQSRALTFLLNMPMSEADVWIDWGIHVFKVTGGTFKKGNALEEYLNAQFDRGEKEPTEDLFSTLTRSRIQGRLLTREECLGFGNLVFAGGRDTIIHSITSIIAYLSSHPAALDYLRADKTRITLASEEFFRVFMPLTQIGRVCPNGTEVHGITVPPDRRVGLCWASANYDETVFDEPDAVRLDRRPNPHVSFGFREHLCQAAHARLVIRSFLESLCDHVERIDVLHATPLLEREQHFERRVGYVRLDVQFHPLDPLN